MIDPIGFPKLEGNFGDFPKVGVKNGDFPKVGINFGKWLQKCSEITSEPYEYRTFWVNTISQSWDFEKPICHRSNSFILKRANPRILSPSLHFSLNCSLFQVLWRIDFPIIIIVFYNFSGRDFSLFFLLFLSKLSYHFPAFSFLASRFHLILSRIIGWIKRGFYEALRGPIRLFFLPYLILPFLSKKRGESKIWPEK